LFDDVIEGGRRPIKNALFEGLKFPMNQT